MKKYIIERNLPGIGGMSPAELGAASTQSNKALSTLSPRVQWQHSYITGDKSFCVYLARDDDAIAEHAQLSGFPADCVTEVKVIIDPSTEAQAM